MLRQSRKLTRPIGVTSMLLMTGCATMTPTAQKAATAALSQLNTLELEIQRKIKAENDYYEQAMDVATARVVELWDAEQPFEFEKQAKQFTAKNLKVSADKLGPKLIDLTEEMKMAWMARDREYETLLTGTQSTLRENRRKLEVERAKVRTLSNKLTNLSAARSDQDMLVFAVAYVRQVKKEYDKIDESAANAANAAVLGASE